MIYPEWGRYDMHNTKHIDPHIPNNMSVFGKGVFQLH